MSVTRDHSLKVCRQFPAFLLFLWQSICRVVRELKSCHRVTLPSQLSGRYCMKKKQQQQQKKNMTNVNFLHLVNFTEFRPFYIHYYSVSSRGICQNRIAGIGLFNHLQSLPFFPGFVSVIYLLWMFHDKKLTPFIIISLNHSTNAFENGVELK